MDIGGTKIAAGLVAFPEGRVLARRIIPTDAQRPGAEVLADALSLARDQLAEAARLAMAPVGLGVGVAELVDPEGRITSDQTIAWRNLPVREAFAALAPTLIDADVRMAARAEARFGAGQGVDPWIYVTVGTGISYCLVQGGHPYTGTHGNALIFASAPLSTTCPVCGTMLQPVLEEIASGSALAVRYNQVAAVPARSGHEVVAAAAAGDPKAVWVVRSGGAALGCGVAFLINTLDPAAVVVGGGLGLAGGLYWEAFIDAARAHIWAEATRDVPIHSALLGVDAGLVGAATTAWDSHTPDGSGENGTSAPSKESLPRSRMKGTRPAAKPTPDDRGTI
ncbi:MAG TPA: ROK family protein [Chloroflexota bacterium]|nr:ROK family protein [Chloroflexota bacterium]